jgi:hypothetical protein
MKVDRCVVTGMVMNGSITPPVKGAASPDFLVLAPKIPFTKVMTIPLKLG